MTRKELQSQHGDKVTDLLALPIFHTVLDVAREDCPFLEDKSPDPTSIVRNEGKIQGWNACLRFMKTIGRVEQAPEKPVTLPRYQDPEKIKSEQNRKQ